MVIKGGSFEEVCKQLHALKNAFVKRFVRSVPIVLNRSYESAAPSEYKYIRKAKRYFQQTPFSKREVVYKLH